MYCKTINCFCRFFLTAWLVAMLVPSLASAQLLENIKLNGPLVPGGRTTRFQISPDSVRVVYSGDQDTDNVNELYSVLADGSSVPVKLNGPLVLGGNVATTFQISPDSSYVVYRADQDTNGVQELYSAPIDGSSVPVKLNGSLVLGGDVSTFRISPESARVV